MLIGTASGPSEKEFVNTTFQKKFLENIFTEIRRDSVQKLDGRLLLVY